MFSFNILFSEINMVIYVNYDFLAPKEILDLLKEQKYPGNVIVELYDYSPEHMLEGIGESVSWVAGVLRE